MVTIREATISDIPSIIDIRIDAFNTPLTRWISANHPINRLHATIDTATSFIMHPEDSHAVACSEDGKVIGFCSAGLETSETIKGTPQTWSLRGLEASLRSWETWFLALPTVLRGRHQRLESAPRVSVLSEALDANREKNTRSLGQFVYVKLLIVDPSSQGQGVGARLLQQCKDLAQENGIPVYLESSRQGYAFYQKVGFVDFGDPCVVVYEGKKLETLPTVLWRA